MNPCSQRVGDSITLAASVYSMSEMSTNWYTWNTLDTNTRQVNVANIHFENLRPNTLVARLLSFLKSLIRNGNALLGTCLVEKLFR